MGDVVPEEEPSGPHLSHPALHSFMSQLASEKGALGNRISLPEQ